MPVIHHRSWVAARPEVAFAFFDEPRNLARLTPFPGRVVVDRVEPDPPRAGSEFTFRYGIGPWLVGSWTVRLVEHGGRVFLAGERDATRVDVLLRERQGAALRASTPRHRIEDRADSGRACGRTT